MLAAYDFFAPGQIVFGWGRRTELGSIARSCGRRAFLVSGSRTLEASGVFGKLVDLLRAAGMEPVPIATITHEPEVADVDDLTARLVQHSAGAGDCLIAIGGGSAIDLAKAASAMATNRASSTVKDFLEGVGRGLQIEAAPLPLIAVPTTAGTGTEATKNAVISSYSPAFKKSLRSSLMVPRAVLIDPELSVGLAPQTTAFTGMDAITQLIESFVTKRARPIPDALCLQGLSLAVPALIEAVENGSSRAARTAMAHAALLSGMALANAGLGLAHGVAAALGVHARVPHGLACAVMLPAAMRVNRDVAHTRLAIIGRTMQQALSPQHRRSEWTSGGESDSVAPPPELVDLAAETCLNNEDAAVTFAISVIETMAKRIGIPTQLSTLGVTADMIPALVPSSRGNSMSGNPRDLSDSELEQLLTGML